MTKILFKNSNQNSHIKKRRGVAEVISTLLLVVITVVGAVILTGFIDESFVSGSLAVSSSTDTTIKAILLRGYDTRDGEDLMGYISLSNDSANLKLCRSGCPVVDKHPSQGGSDFLVIQVENRSVNPVFLKNVYLDRVEHTWDSLTGSQDLLAGSPDSTGGAYPSDGMFSILSTDISDLTQRANNQINSGETVNLLIKLDTTSPDIDLSKTMRVQLNIGANQLSEFFIESGGAQ